jgi:hypothetical protein
MVFLGALLAVAGCALERPIHPYRLEGFPGAPIEGDLFPMRPGMRWVFRDRLKPDGPPLELATRGSGEELELLGRKADATLRLRTAGPYVEIVDGTGAVVDRPLRLDGRVGDTWSHAGATYTVFGYDRLEILGERLRALVVAVDRPPARDLFWFAPEVGWVRLRTELHGAVQRDALLVEFQPGDAGPN